MHQYLIRNRFHKQNYSLVDIQGGKERGRERKEERRERERGGGRKKEERKGESREKKGEGQMKDYDTKKKGVKTYTCNKCTCTISSHVQYRQCMSTHRQTHTYTEMTE